MTSTTEPETAEVDLPQVRPLRKKGVAVATLLWTGHNADQLAAWSEGNFQPVDPEDRGEDPDITGQVYDKLHSTWVGAKTGQSIVRGVKREYYPIDADVLDETYEEPVPVTTATALVAAFKAYAASVGWEIETNLRDHDRSEQSYDLYVWPANGGD